MLTPAPAELPSLTLADRFWAYGAGAAVEADDAPEPLRSVMITRNFLSALDRLDATSPRKAAAALVAMLRQAELDGDLSYASPEQVRGEILDTRSVVFSLGVVLFERLTGRHPFGAENNRPRRIDRIRKGELGSGVNSFPTVAAGLRSVLVRAMSPFSEERWPDLRQMRELLAQFITQEAPAPRLPGTEGPEDTRVVRMATEFGRELMQVVARNDAPRGTTRSSQRLGIPTSGVTSVTGANVGILRREPDPTSDSMVTRLDVPRLEARIDAQLRDDSQPQIVELKKPAPAPASSALAAAAPAIARTRSPRPTPPRITGPVRSAADTRAALAASLPVLPPLPSPPPSFELPLPAPPESLVSMPSPRRRGRAIVLAGIGAAVGGSLALALFLALGSSPASTASSVSTALPTPPAPASTPPAITQTPAAVSPSPAAEAAPAPAPALAVAAPTLHEQVAAAITPCLSGHNGKFGISLLFRYGVVSKPYYASGDGLSAAEHGCLGKSLKGQTFAGAPKSEVLELKIKVSKGSVVVSPWK